MRYPVIISLLKSYDASNKVKEIRIIGSHRNKGESVTVALFIFQLWCFRNVVWERMKTIKLMLYFFTNCIENVFQQRYLLLSLFLLGRYAIYSTSGLWIEDFWEHSAVVREFMTHPLNPTHPQLQINATHAFFTPYALLVAATGWMLDIDAITSLAFFGLINLALLCFGLRLFLATLDPENRNSIAFYTLILTLFFWGNEGWQFSGFYSLVGLNSVLPYPSSFALALSLIGLTVHSRQLRHSSIAYQIALILICASILITHPLTAIFFLVGLVCQTLTIVNLCTTDLIKVAATIACSVLLTFAWPYFSMLELMTGGGNAYNYSNTPMYLAVFDHIWPTLLALPVILVQALKAKSRTVGLILLCLVFIYIGGYISTKYSYGRSIAFILLITNILLAQTIVHVERTILYRYALAAFMLKVILVFILSFYLGLWLKQTTSRFLTIGNSIYLGRPIASQILYRDLLFISNYTQQDDLIMADIERSWIIPTLGGKVVATDHPLAFVPNWYKRKLDLIEFFNPETSPMRREEIFDSFHPNFLLITKTEESNWMMIFKQFTTEAKGIKVFEDNKYVLLKFNPLQF